jgi:flagellar hook protein FlgE
MSFGQGLSGLNAAAQNLDVIGNNVANSATVGFKGSSVSFGDVYATSRVGLGVGVTGVTNRFTVGAVNGSGSSYHMALDKINGFFRMTDSAGGVFYTRNGEFSVDAKNNLVNNGYQLTGYPAGGVGQAPVALTVPKGNIAPAATTEVKVTANLSANAKVIGPTVVFDAKDANTYSIERAVTVYDSLGNDHELTQYFVKRNSVAGKSVYDIHYSLDGAPLPTAGTQQLVFDAEGRLTSNPKALVKIAAIGGASSPAADLELNFNYTGSTQFGGSPGITALADGYESGTFTGLTVGKDGSLLGQYSNGKSQVVGTVVLAGFTNMEGLRPVGANMFVATNESGPATLGEPGTNGLSDITGGSLEASNVDMSKELVDMIIAQRTYQANAQTIKTQDQVLQTLLQIR